MRDDPVGIDSLTRQGGADPNALARMLVLSGGREHGLADHSLLAGHTGLSVRQVQTTPLGQVGIECSPTAKT